MMLCPQCHGNGVTKIDNQPLNVPNGLTFTAQTQVAEVKCNYCGGNGYYTGAGS